MAVSSYDVDSLSFNVNSLNFDGSVDNADEKWSVLEKTKTGVKDFVDSGFRKVPDFFIFPKQNQQCKYNHTTTHISSGHQEILVIDLKGLLQGERRNEIVSEVRKASETWGIFQLINHEVPEQIIHSLLECVQLFNEQPKELKSQIYTSDMTKKVQYRITTQPLLKVALWKETLLCYFDDLSTEEIEALPSVCRKPMSDYIRFATKLKDTLSELLSEALGLTRDYLKLMGCMDDSHLASHYAPACPEPELAMGTPKHSDPHFLTLLVQNDIDALQVLYENQWIDVNVKEGAIIASIGDMLQIVINDIFKSAEHRVLARSSGPRLSAACFFNPAAKDKDRVYGPIKELLKCDNEPAFFDTSYAKYVDKFWEVGVYGVKPLNELRK